MSEKQVTPPFPARQIDSNYSMGKALLNRWPLQAYPGTARPRKEVAQLLRACQGTP